MPSLRLQTSIHLIVLTSLCLTTPACHRQTRGESDDPFLAISDTGEAIRTYTERTRKHPDDAQAWRDLGQALLNLNEYEKAAEALQRAAQLDPSRADTWALLGLAARKQKKIDEAAIAYGQALDRSPESTEYLTAYRELMESRGRQRELVAKVVDKVATGASGTRLLNSLAKDYLRAGVTPAAEDAARASLRLERNQPETYLMLATALERQERWADAARTYEELLQLDPARTAAIVGLGQSQLGMGDMRKAEETFHQALSRDPRSVEALQGLIRVYLEQDDLARASSLLRDAITLAPDSTALQVSQAELYLKQGHAGQALTVLKLAQVHAPDDLRLNQTMGAAYLKAGQPERAIEWLDRADRLSPGDSRILRQRCEALLEAGRKGQYDTQCQNVDVQSGTVTVRNVSEASTKRKVYRKAPSNRRTRTIKSAGGSSSAGANPRAVAAELPQQLRPMNIPLDSTQADKAGASAAFAAGQSMFKAGEYWNAAEAFRKAAELDPLNSNYYYNLGVTYAAMNEYEMASEAFKEVLTLSPRDVDALYNLGTTFFRVGNYPDAIVAYQQVLKISANDQEAYRSMGAAYEALGQLQKAQECYRLGGGQPAMEELE